MKRTTIVVTLALLLIAAPAALAKSTITVNPLGLLSGIGTVEFETQMAQLGREKTFVVQAASWNPGDKMRATGFSAGVRHYLDGRAHDRVYIGGYGGLIDVSGSVSARILSVTGVAGYKWNFPSGLVVDAGAGMSIPLSTQPISSNATPERLVRVTGMNMYVGVGYTF